MEIDIVKLMVEIKSFGMSADELDNKTRLSDGLQPNQADLSCVHALNEHHLHEIHVVPSKHEADQGLYGGWSSELKSVWVMSQDDMVDVSGSRVLRVDWIEDRFVVRERANVRSSRVSDVIMFFSQRAECVSLRGELFCANLDLLKSAIICQSGQLLKLLIWSTLEAANPINS
ncbi:hypothetical protein Tco_0126757 [Tanacetum coccineum]